MSADNQVPTALLMGFESVGDIQRGIGHCHSQSGVWLLPAAGVTPDWQLAVPPASGRGELRIARCFEEIFNGDDNQGFLEDVVDMNHHSQPAAKAILDELMPRLSDGGRYTFYWPSDRASNQAAAGRADLLRWLTSEVEDLANNAEEPAKRAWQSRIRSIEFGRGWITITTGRGGPPVVSTGHDQALLEAVIRDQETEITRLFQQYCDCYEAADALRRNLARAQRKLAWNRSVNQSYRTALERLEPVMERAHRQTQRWLASQLPGLPTGGPSLSTTRASDQRPGDGHGAKVSHLHTGQTE
ncbi:MAG: hypothetical protein ACK5UG_09055 [Synechococcaceae cyanobacterium]